VVTVWTLTLRHDLSAFFSPAASIIGSVGTVGRLMSRIFFSEAAVVGVYAILLVSAICLVLGFHSRLAATLVFIGLVLFQRRNPFIVNAGDRLLSHLGFFLMLAPSGAALSLDRWRRTKTEFWKFPERAPWALRLVQIQVSLMYLATVWEKLQGETWLGGTAVAYAWGIGDLSRFAVPAFLRDSLPLVNFLTWSTLAIELALGVLVWVPRLRPWVLALGVALHLSIEVTMSVGFFSYAVFVAYLAFVPPQAMSALVLKVRDRLRGSRQLRTGSGLERK
jgi:vitamin K-dependent gamma-carboxylase-like protein